MNFISIPDPLGERYEASVEDEYQKLQRMLSPGAPILPLFLKGGSMAPFSRQGAVITEAGQQMVDDEKRRQAEAAAQEAVRQQRFSRPMMVAYPGDPREGKLFVHASPHQGAPV